jgi:hypothetical protein
MCERFWTLPPREDLQRRKPMAASHVRNDGAWDKRLFYNPRLKLRCKLTPASSAANYFQSVNRRQIRLKHMVKLRHEPTSESEISTVVHHNRQ